MRRTLGMSRAATVGWLKNVPVLIGVGLDAFVTLAV
jgi:hypothetical protein